MKNRVTLRLSLRRVLFLVIAASAALAGPIVLIVASARTCEAQSVRGGQTGRRGGADTSPARLDYRIGKIRLIGAKAYSEEKLLSVLGMGPGDLYQDAKLQSGLTELKNLYQTRGNLNFAPDPSFNFDEGLKVVDVTINIYEGSQYTVNSIKFMGNTTVRDDILRREIPLKAGSVFNFERLESAIPRLNQLGRFEEIKPGDFTVEPLPNGAKVDVVLRVKEKAR